MANKYYREKKPGPKRKTTDAPFSQDVQDQVISFLGQEFSAASKNTEVRNKEFKEYYDMVHCERTKATNYESDIFLPEFVSRLLTQIGNFVSQYFSSRDFVESVIQSDDPWDVAEGKASKKLLNGILNAKKSRYFTKLIRLLMFVFPTGSGIIKGGYVQKTRIVQVATRQRFEPVADESGQYLAEDGFPYVDSLRQTPMLRTIEEPVYEEEVIEDRPTFDVYPNQYVHISPEYQYSLQDKEYVIFETEKTLDELEDLAEQEGYFNLNLLEDMEGDTSDHRTKAANPQKDYDDPKKKVSESFVILERWGKYPTVCEKDEKGDPIYGTEKPGIDKEGEVVKRSELRDCQITYVKKPGAGNDLLQMIGFKLRRTSMRPMVRFLCYIDALDDNGFGDGKVNSELQTATNDMYNLSNYRSLLATTPAFKGKRWAGLPDKIEVSPEKVIPLEDVNDLQELDIKDNMMGAMNHIATLSSRMDYAMATSPATMGMEPERRETATMGAIIDRRASIRIGMKSMNLEFVGFVEFYDMLLSLCNDFMLPQTIKKHCGDDAQFYNPQREDQFRPVSQALETEEGKNFKIRMWDQVLGRVVAIPNPKTPMVVNYILGQILELMGGDFKHFKKFMLTEDPETMLLYLLATGNQKQVGSTPNMGGGGMSNQNMIPQSSMEQGTREATRNEGGF